MNRRTVGKLSLLALMLAASLGVSAQDFPSKTVKIIVPQTPGGASDTLARIIGRGRKNEQQGGYRHWAEEVIASQKPVASPSLRLRPPQRLRAE